MHKIPATVLSRCQRHEFRRVPVDDIVSQLKRIVESEKLIAEPEALTLIARQAAGGMRDAISLLDQMASTGKEITLGLTQIVLGTATSQIVIALVEAMLRRVQAAGMEAIHTALDSGSDPRLLARQVVDYLRALLLIQMGNVTQANLAADIREQAEKHARAFSMTDLLRMIKSFNAASTDLLGGWQPALPLELALAEGMETPAADVPIPTARVSLSSSPDGMSSKIPSSAQGKQAPKILYQAANPHENEQSISHAKVAEEPALADEAGVTLNQVAKVWKQVSAAIKPHSSTLNGLLNSSKLLEVKDRVLVLGFTSELLRSKADTPEQMEIIRKAIREVLGADVSVKCVVTNAKQSTPPNVKADGMVAAALKAGGEIVDTQE
jgi:DNA polymerase-3 subunit gamma/tau